MNYAPRNARVKLRNCPHEYAQGRGEEGEGKQDEQFERIYHFPLSKMSKECGSASPNSPRLRNGQGATTAAKHVIRRHLL